MRAGRSSIGLLLVFAWATSALADGQDAAAIGKALANPLSDVWALFTEFDFSSNEGDIPGGDSRWTYNTTFQPVLPVPQTEN